MSPIEKEYERFLHEKIHELRLRHEKELKPFMDGLARLHSLRPPEPIIIDAAAYAAADGAHKEGD